MFNVATNTKSDTKNVLIDFIGTDRAMEQITLRRNATPKDVFRQLGLTGNEYVLSAGQALPAFGSDEQFFERVPEGAILEIGSMMDAGCK